MPLSAGVARGDITPPQNESILGYNIRPIKGFDNDITVTCLALAAGGAEYLIITTDLIWISTGFNAAVKEAVSGATGINADSVILAAIHTHSGPLVWEWRDNYPGAEYRDTVVGTIVKTAEKARRAMKPCTVGYGTTELDLAHNQRVIKEDGLCENVWTDVERAHTGPVDRELRTVCFKDGDGNLSACLVNFSCHPVTLGPGNHFVSADFCGYARRMLERELPGTLVLYTNGTAGNLNPYDCITDDFDVSRKVGETVGAGVLECIRGMEFSGIEGFRQAVSDIRVVPLEDLEPVGMKRPDVKAGKITAPMHLLELGGLLFVTLPGEPVVEIGDRLRQKSGAKLTVPIGYANGSIGYLPTRGMVPQGGLEVQRSPSPDVETPILDAFRDGAENLGMYRDQ